MTKKIAAFFFTMFVVVCYAQEQRPKLVVGIMVDQMRYEYLERFYSKYSNDGFKRLMNDGFNLKNAHYNYVPTYTGPGHSSVYTGTTPAIHGIIGNDWYDKNLKKGVNCVNDPTRESVGVQSEEGHVSPWRLLSSTITDELKLATQKRSKVIGISIKDRGAVLPAGHMADAAYWYEDASGTFISSTFYLTKLPQWVDVFNKKGLPAKYLSQPWNTLYPIEQYVESSPDDSPYEQRLGGNKKPVFPYKYEVNAKTGYGALTATPFCNDFLTEFALAAVDGEKLGQGDYTDFLAISYSTTDRIGHAMGPNSVEVEDVYLRLDKNIENLLNQLDAKIGKGNYLVFLSADHAVADVAQYLKDSKMPAGYFNDSAVESNLREFLKKYFPERDLIQNISNGQVFFNNDLFQTNPRNSGVDFLIASELISKFLLAVDGVANVYTENVLRQARYDEEGLKGMVIRGYNAKRSGDIAFVLEPGWYSSSQIAGATHGSPYAYDTHVPMLFYGAGVRKGSSVRYHPVTDIAPTLSMLLRIKFPSGCTGQPVAELFE
ncbi:MAG TPA: alkaline phosphatase PafA [Cyclobacteriaceae bacterium]|nr:alkaline phosphatase PafA [Cyclobacteriaceae bacterium]